jgi:hypothetical protein
LGEIGFPQSSPTFLECDNKNVVLISEEDEVHERTKHWRMRVHLIQEYVWRGIVKFRFIFGNDNSADIHTKPLQGQAFTKHQRFTSGSDLVQKRPKPARVLTIKTCNFFMLGVVGAVEEKSSSDVASTISIENQEQPAPQVTRRRSTRLRVPPARSYEPYVYYRRANKTRPGVRFHHSKCKVAAGQAEIYHHYTWIPLSQALGSGMVPATGFPCCGKLLRKLKLNA